ncbi:MAG: N-acetylmuramoyl-L-alanine amidase [Armatimonadetes bacterium]|nr:N-acetylmuramoyl-L-alanine amidase [Armatimonadota bacterium]MCX7966868.1 N-acetylmuramoyl-L-alanine amidase [Armatimonadota bacterium]MDW8141826.1 N-acetylmuramoyl-L-alanine amidase [Armatimonadota bacterium]
MRLQFKITIFLLVALAKIAVAQNPTPTRLLLLGEAFPNLTVFWDSGEPFAPAGDWMSALKLHWTVRSDGIEFETPNRFRFFWSKEATNLTVNGRNVEVTPLRQQEGVFLLPLISLARVLGLTAIVNQEKKVVKLVAPLRSIEASRTEFGFLVSIAFGYPLPTFPKIGVLRQPDRAYSDFTGAALSSVNLPTLTEMHPLTGFRLGQFSDDPPVIRFVADAVSPVSIRVAGRELTTDGCEKWHLILQPAEKPSPWLGQILVKENSPTKAAFLLLGHLDSGLNFKQESLTLVVNLPAKPVFASEFIFRNDGLVKSASLDLSENEAKLVIELREPANAYWRPEGDLGITFAVELSYQTPKQSRLIVVDAGHGGKDPGAISPFRRDKPRLIEKELTLDIAFRLKRLLEQAGYKVVMTRTDDTYVSLPDRVAIANSLQAHAFVSVHLNSYPQPGGQWGTEVYYWTPQSYPLAESIYRHLLALLGRKGNGIRQRQLYVVRNTTMPSVLVESCYMNHPEEEELLRDEDFRERIALAICRGILEFFGDLRMLERRGE